MAKYIHYVTIDAVKYPFFESNSPVININDLTHPNQGDTYLLDIGETKTQRKQLEKEFKKFSKEPDFLIIPKARITTIGSQPIDSFSQTIN